MPQLLVRVNATNGLLEALSPDGNEVIARGWLQVDVPAGTAPDTPLNTPLIFRGRTTPESGE